MGNLCIGDAQQTVLGIEDADEMLDNQEQYDDFDYQKIEKPRPEVAYDIDNLPAGQREEKKLAKLQERIRQMQANQRKGKKYLKVTRKHPAGQMIPSPFVLRYLDCIYIGEWVFNSILNSSVPGGIGRLYKQDEIMEGQFLTVFDQNDIQSSFANKNLSETLIRESSKRAKFFQVDVKRVIADGTNVKKKIKVVLDGEGRIFSRTKEISGTFEQGILNGKGSVIIREEKQVYEYAGDFAKGKKQGKGLEKYQGNVYQGDFRDDKKNGKGILTLFITHKFQEQQKKQAQTLQKDNKERDSSKLNLLIQKFIQYRKQKFDLLFDDAIKEFKWKKPEGILKSKKFLDDADFLLQHFRRNKFVQYYKGEFKDNLFEGVGRYVWFNGKTYDGTWKAGKMDGYGQFFWHNGGYYYQGEYKDDLKHGKGTMYWGLTKRYRGTWALGFRHGYGQLISIESVTKNVEQNLNSNILNILSLLSKKKQQKNHSKITVIGALFNKDEISKEYFKKTVQNEIQIDKLTTKFIICNSKVIGIRCDLKDPDTDPKQQEEQEQKKK